MKPHDAYREGYDKGRADNLAGNVAEAIHGQLRDDPGGYYAAGYRDGARGNKFQLPSPATAPASPPILSATETEKAWLGLCRSSEFISLPTARDYWERLKTSTEGSAVYMVGLHPFFKLPCPLCGERQGVSATPPSSIVCVAMAAACSQL